MTSFYNFYKGMNSIQSMFVISPKFWETKKTSVDWWLTVGDGGLDGGGRGPQHQTGHTAMAVLTGRAVGAAPQTAVLGCVLRTGNLDFLGLDRLWGFPAGNLRYPLRDQFIDVILDDLFSL